MVKGPPYSDGLPYLKRSFERWCATNRPTWTSSEIKWTAMTLWHGSADIQNAFRRKVGKKFTYPMHRPDLVPANPWTEQDSQSAKSNKTLPLAPGVVPPAPPIPPGFEPASPLPSPTPAPAPAPIIQERPRNAYTFDFWPSKPWDAEPPEDDSLANGISTGSISRVMDHRALWRATNPFMWPPQVEKDWKNGRFLGGGGYGCAGMWCQVDENNNIIRRMVVKETRPNPRYWRDPVRWRDQKPREIHTHQLVDRNRQAACEQDYQKVVEHYGYRLMMEQRRYRVFLNYYEGGDLEEALRDHAIATLRRYERLDPDDDVPPGWEWDENYWCYRENGELPEVISERLIWKIISDIVTGCQILHYGQPSQNGKQKMKPGWKPIIHCDLKIDNIFIIPSGEVPGWGEDETKFPNFVIGDLGNAVTAMQRTDPSASENPIENVLNLRFERLPPELQNVMMGDAERPGPVPLSEKTDVWLIGSILYNLLANVTKNGHGPCRFVPDAELEYDFFAGARGDLGPTHTGSFNPFRPTGAFPTFLRYSPQLQLLAASCLTWKPHQRPPLLEIRTRVDDFLATHPEIAADRTIRPLVVKRDKAFWVGRYF